MVKKTMKRYLDEVQIVDGLIITILLIVIMIFNWNIFINTPLMYIVSMFLFLWIILFFVVMTIKDIFVFIDEIQVSIAFVFALMFVLALIYLGEFIWVNIIVLLIVCIYSILFLFVFVRNLILELVYKDKNISW